MSENGYVFISYSSKDVNYVMQLTEAFERAGVSYWKAPERIPAGSNYAKEIPKAISECSVFLLVYSKNSQDSIWVEKELDRAICEHKEIIPIRIDGCEFSDLFKFYLNNVQMISVAKKEDKITNIDKIVGKISAELKFEFEKTIKEEINGKMEVFSEETNVSRRVDKRSNALRTNKIPLECEYCGGSVELKSIGVYVCNKCKKENYDDFYKVRKYIETYGPAPAIVISKHTGVSRTSIEQFLKG